MERSKASRFWPVVAIVVLLDVVTKAAAVRLLVPQRMPHDVLGEVVRFTLVYNPGAAFGLGRGFEYSRWLFLVLTLVALGILGWLYRTADGGDRPRVLAIALVCAGAIGNLIDRIRHDLGVVDFIDIGVGAARWPTFNVADIAVSCGAMLLAWVLWHEAPQPAGAAAPARRLSADSAELT
jgi:signal peptidase II